MKTSKINRDHDYGELEARNHHLKGNTGQVIASEINVSTPVIKSTKSTAKVGKEVIGGQIKDINELKKIAPRVKLLAHDVNSLKELTKISLQNKDQACKSNELSILEQTKQELKKYCRTCAGLKLPLVDIFSEKGIQMRLSQQIKHLEEIDPHDSLTTQMCMDCICDLKMSYKFFMQIKKAEMKLKSIHVTLTETATRNANAIQCVASNQTNEEREAVENTVVPAATITNVNEEIIPKISTVYSLKDIPKSSSSEKKETMNSDISRTEAEIFGDTTEDHHSDDSESIEEFDPDDPPLQLDSSDNSDCDGNNENEEHNQHNKQDNSEELPSDTAILHEALGNKSVKNNTNQDTNQTIYKYDMALRSYVKVDKSKENNLNSKAETSKSSTMDYNDLRSTPKQPNILKRKLAQQTTKEVVSSNEETNSSSATLDTVGVRKDSKIQKLDLNSLALSNTQEDGIMYVTVKGSKPNEILLVKVKKMDKSLNDKKEEKPSNKTILDIKPVEKILKRFETFTTKEKELFGDRSKKPDKKEQIIEEQIEEYKRKREKLLGSQTSLGATLRNEEMRIRLAHQMQNSDDQIEIVHTDNSYCIKMPPEMENGRMNTFQLIQKEESSVSDVSDAVQEKSTEEKPQINVTEDLEKLEKSKPENEEIKKKKDTLQKELDQSYNDPSTEKLVRVLEDTEENFPSIEDYIKQRKMIVVKPQEEETITFYEDKNSAPVPKNLPDLTDETMLTEPISEENYLECDYCLETFTLKEILEEHMQIHDFKIMHYCEDCSEEFSTNKAKRNHNVICIKKLICRYCNAMLDSKGKKRQHEQKHCDNMFGQLCDVCGEKFKHQGTLDQHIKTQHMSWEKIFECPKCPKKFAFKQKLSFHLKSVHTTLRAYLCEDCGADFKNPASLRHHRIRKHQPVGNTRECPVCHKLVPFYSLSKHMYTHKAYTIQCPHCDKMFKNSSTLKQHVRIHEDQRQYRCDTCGVGFNRRDGLRLHMRVHEKTDSRGLKECSCQVCGEKFPNHSTLVIHRNRVHKDGRQYTCHICNRSMISTRSLEWHMSHIHNESLPGIIKEEVDGLPEKKRVTCYHCHKTFKTEMILRTHIKNTHMEKDPMKCSDCDMTFTSEVRLRHHMMVTHNRLEGTLACPHCPKRFVNQLRLKTHMISHSEERPYTCEICGFNLKTKIQLIKHHQNRHSDERPLQCRYCPWRCKQVSALVCHERTHTNERPYSCSVCRQRFKYLGDKNKHERRHESLGGSGFKRIVPGRNIKHPKVQEESSCSEQEQEELTQVESQLTEEKYEEQASEPFEEKFVKEQIKFEEPEIAEEYEQVYEQDYEETSRETSEAAEVIMNMEETTVYTEEVTADNMESAEMITDEIITNDILQSGTVVHLQQQDDSGKIQVIPVMLSLSDLSDTNAEVNLATASIMYNN